MVKSPHKITLLGVVAVGAAIAVSSFGIVRAERATPDNQGIFRCNSGAACVEGHSTGRTTDGVMGISATVDGVAGVTFSVTGKPGVRGASRSTSGKGYGVIGTSANGDGVVGVSEDLRSAGVKGVSKKGEGVLAESTADGLAALYAEADTSKTAIFVGHNGPNTARCVIDANANLSCTGSVTSKGAVESTHQNSSGQRVITYAPQSATATIEDVGTQRMVEGVANVRIDPRFAGLTDHGWYYVFLTPLGDTRGLYVSRKSGAGFQVREVQGGKANLEFDYRIVAHPNDAPHDRLPAQ